MNDPIFVLDGDDTLWLTETLYDRARKQIAEAVAREGMDPAAWESLERRIDVENVARYGLSPERFPASCAEAYERLARSSGHSPSRPLSCAIQEMARSASRRKAPLAPGAATIVTNLSRLGRCVLLTRGDVEIQRQRFADSGLEPYFAHLQVVRTKTPETFKEILLLFDADAAKSWSIGNSFRFDVEPALAVGMQAILIDSYTWEYERDSPPQLPAGAFRIAQLIDALAVIREDSADGRVQARVEDDLRFG